MSKKYTMFATDKENLKLVQKELKTYIIEYCESFSPLWSDHLENISIQNGFLDLQMQLVHNDMKQNTLVQLQNYKDLFEESFKLSEDRKILILGEAGCGKSTYVRKLALDWACGDEYLRSKFDIGLFFDKYSLTTTIADGLHQFVSNQFYSLLLNLLKNSHKVLIIFDNISILTEIYYEIQKQHRLYPLVTVLITSRISRYPYVNSVSDFVWIDGFNDTAVVEFMKMQKCEQTSNEKIPDLLHLPLFCAIYCSLQRSGYLSTVITDSFDLIKNYIDCSIDNYFQQSGTTYTKEEVHENLLALGKYAFINLIGNLHNDELRDLQISVSQNSYDCENLSLSNILHFGLLKERKVLTGKHLEFQKGYDVIHQLIAEYLAAYYVASIINIDLHMINLCYMWFNEPILEYLLYKIFLPWKDGQFSNNVIDKYLDCGDTCLALHCKSPNNQTVADKLYDMEKVDLDMRGFLRNVDVFSKLMLCKKLKKLAIYSFYITTHSVNALTNVINLNGFKNLEIIFIDKDWNIGKDVDLFPSLSNCVNLNSLTMYNCNITLECANAFVIEMFSKKFFNLKILRLPENPEIGKVVGFFSALSRCPNVSELNLSKCNMSSESLRTFSNEINLGSFQNLEVLDFNCNPEIGLDIEFFGSLSKLPKIADIDFSYCNITRAALQAWTSAMNLNKFPNLQKLYVSGNENVGKEIPFVNALVAHCKGLRYLILYNCNLTPESTEVLNDLKNRQCDVNIYDY